MWIRRVGRAAIVGVGALAIGASSGFAAAGPSNLQQTMPLVWVLVAMSVAGAVVTFAYLTYAVWKFRDPRARRRRYG